MQVLRPRTGLDAVETGAKIEPIKSNCIAQSPHASYLCQAIQVTIGAGRTVASVLIQVITADCVALPEAAGRAVEECDVERRRPTRLPSATAAAFMENGVSPSLG